MEHKHHNLVRHIFMGVAGCILLLWALYDIDRLIGIWNTAIGMLSPVIVGACLAFIMNVPMRLIERWLKPVKNAGARRGISIGLTSVFLILVIVGVFMLLIPQLVETIEALIPQVEKLFTNLSDKVMNFVNGDSDVMMWVRKYTDIETLDIGGMASKLVAILGDLVTLLLSNILTIVTNIVSGLFNAVIAIVLAIYFLFQKEVLSRQGRRVLYAYLPEPKADYVVRVLRLANSTFSNFLSGQCLEVVILGSMFAISMAIFQMPYIPLVSVLVAITAFIPVVGAWVGCILGAFLILVANPVQAFWFVILFVILQQIENNLIYPRVVGSSIGLSGLWVMLAIIIGGEIMGVIGMFVMIPAVSVVYTLLGEHTAKRLKERGIDPEKLRDQPPVLRSKFKEKREKKRAHKAKSKK